MWFAGLQIFSLRPVFRLLFGVNAKLRPLFAKVAEWHFRRLSAIGNPFKALTAFYAFLCSSY